MDFQVGDLAMDTETSDLYIVKEISPVWIPGGGGEAITWDYLVYHCQWGILYVDEDEISLIQKMP